MPRAMSVPVRAAITLISVAYVHAVMLDPARGQPMELTGQLSGQYVPAPSNKASNALVLPEGTLEVGGDLSVVMSKAVVDRAGFEQRQLDFSDAAILRVRARYSLGWLETFTATELFAKQPEFLDEPVWQASRLGIRIPVVQWLAGSVIGGVGQQQAYGDIWWQVEPTLSVKPELTRNTYAELGLGTSHRWFAPPSAAAWPVPAYALQELTCSAELSAGDDTGGGWIGFEYRLPMASSPERAEVPAGQAYIESGPQLSFQLGGVASPGDEWEFFAYFSIIDRGDLHDRNTQLPVFSGGFDQQQLTLGLQRRFGPK